MTRAQEIAYYDNMLSQLRPTTAAEQAEYDRIKALRDNLAAGGGGGDWFGQFLTGLTDIFTPPGGTSPTYPWQTAAPPEPAKAGIGGTLLTAGLFIAVTLFVVDKFVPGKKKTKKRRR